MRRAVLTTLAASACLVPLFVVGTAAQSPPSVRVVGEARGGHVVSSSGRGLAVVPAAVVRRLEDAEAGVPDPLPEVRALIADGNFALAEEMLLNVLRVDPASASARRLLAAVMRATWRSGAAFTLLEALVAEAGSNADLGLLREAAEVALITGERRRADIIRRYRRAASRARDKEGEAHADRLLRQAEGGAPIAFHGPPPAVWNELALARSRATIDTNRGTHAVAASAALQMESLLTERDENLPVGAKVTISAVPKENETAYLSGGPEQVFCRAVRTATAVVRVRERPWKALYDHQKQEELQGLAAIMRARFPNANMIVQVANEAARALLMAEIRLAYGKSPEVTLHTDRSWDPQRDQQITDEMQEAEDERKGIRRPGR